jgi:cobalt/nickel transport protein
VLIPLLWSTTALAHFGMLIPSDTMVMQQDQRTIDILLSFSHPMEMIGMELEKPKRFGVVVNGKEIDLLTRLAALPIMGHQGWKTAYTVKRPGIYLFFMEPQPYWEPAEDCFIIHHTKSVVTAFGDDEGWDSEIGLKTEIVPLAKPFGLYAGNVFQGLVKLNGKAVPYSEVEVEHYNEQRNASAPTDYMVTQSIKADGKGIFTFAVPAPGWWGFAALNSADFKLKHENVDKDVELGAVIWIKFHPWQRAGHSKQK